MVGSAPGVAFRISKDIQVSHRWHRACGFPRSGPESLGFLTASIGIWKTVLIYDDDD